MMSFKLLVVIVLLLAAVAFFGAEIFLTLRESKVLATKNVGLVSEIEFLNNDKQKVTNDINYYADPTNLAKLLREKFNYKSPGEKMMIIVPGN
jgi:hypothetical protein